MSSATEYENNTISSQRASDLASTEETVRKLTEIWEQLLGFSPIALHDNYFDIGGDSSLAVQLFARIDQVFEVKLPLAVLFDAPTIAELSQVLTQEIAAAGWSPLVRIQPQGSRPPLFCIHPHGGNVLIYRSLSRHLGEEQPFYGLQSPGMDGSRAPLATVEEMAEVYVREIRKVQPQGPYFLGGYCLGGIIAYEMAQQLQAVGERIGVLALIDTVNSSEVPEWFWAKTYYLLQRGAFHIENFLRLNWSGKLTFVREKADSLSSRVPVWLSLFSAGWRSKPSETRSEAWILGQIWKANFQAAIDYLPMPYAGAVVDIRPSKQYRIYSKSQTKWEWLAKGGQQVFVLPVNPPGLLIEPFVEEVARTLADCIDRAQRNCHAQ